MTRIFGEIVNMFCLFFNTYKDNFIKIVKILFWENQFLYLMAGIPKFWNTANDIVCALLGAKNYWVIDIKQNKSNDLWDISVDRRFVKKHFLNSGSTQKNPWKSQNTFFLSNFLIRTSYIHEFFKHLYKFCI